MKNIVDSCGWLEYFAEGENAELFAAAIEGIDELIVPTVSLYEVFKRVYQQRGESEALRAVAVMMQGQVVELNGEIALAAAKVSVELGLPMADSIMLATARVMDAVLWTEDEHFADMEGVQYVRKG